jgi:hypothetical protein
VGDATLETPAWLMRGITTRGAKLGTLKLDRGRLSFRERGADEPLFDLALADVGDVKFPWYNLGSVVRFDAGGERYRLAFLGSEVTWWGTKLRDALPALRWGRRWRAALEDVR